MRPAPGGVSYALAFAGGLIGSLHCIGMCGGFVAILATAAGDRAWHRVVAYNLARVATLAAIGAVAGAFGAAFVALGPIAVAERALAVVAGAVIALVGLEAMGWLPARGQRVAAWVQGSVARALGDLLRGRSLAGPFAFGVLNAFLPCHLIYAFAAMAAGTGSIVAGYGTMLAFGLGTVPAMMAPGAARTLLAGGGGQLRRLAGGVVVVVGLLTVARGLVTLHGGHVH